MLSPKKMKFRKVFKGKIKGHATCAAGLEFGIYGFKACEADRISDRQIEAVRQCISRGMNRQGKIWHRLFPHIPVTAKAAASRMGGGKGNIDRYVAKVYPGTMLFEISGVSEEKARQVFDLASSKFSIKIKFVKKEEGVHVEYN